MNGKEIAEEIRKKLNQTIVENRKLLTEKWSYSSDVEEESNKLIDILQTQFLNGCCEKITNDILLFIGKLNNYVIFGKPITVQFYAYNCASKELVGYLYNGGGFYIDGYKEEENTLILTLYAVKNKLQEGLTKKTIVHEVEHIMQSIYGMTNNEKYTKLVSDIYNVANEVLQEPNRYCQMDNIVANAIYYANSHEQDALIQEYYQDLKNNRFIQITKKAKIHVIMKFYYNCCDVIKDNCTENDLKRYKIFGLKKSNLLTYINKQAKRLEKKIRNVEKHFPLYK